MGSPLFAPFVRNVALNSTCEEVFEWCVLPARFASSRTSLTLSIGGEESGTGRRKARRTVAKRSYVRRTMGIMKKTIARRFEIDSLFISMARVETLHVAKMGILHIYFICLRRLAVFWRHYMHCECSLHFRWRRSLEIAGYYPRYII